MKNVILLLLLFLSSDAFTQGFKLAGIKYNNYLKSTIANPVDNQEVAFQEMSFFFNIPVKFKNQKTTIINGFNYNLIQAKFYNSLFLPPSQNPKYFNKISYAFTIVQKLKEKWTLITRLAPILASDFKQKLGRKDFFFQGLALVSYQFNPTFKMGTGIIYTNQTFYPALQIQYKKNKHFLDALLPIRITYLYRLGKKEKLSLGVKGAFTGGHNNTNFTNSELMFLETISKVIYSRTNIGGLINIKLTTNIQLEAFGGLSVARQFKFQKNDGTFGDLNPENGAFFSIGLNIVPQKKKTND